MAGCQRTTDLFWLAAGPELQNIGDERAQHAQQLELEQRAGAQRGASAS